MRPLFLLCLVSLCSVGCRKGMVNQPRLNPLAESLFFSNASGARVPPAHTVARGNLRADERFFTGKNAGQLITELPTPLTTELVERGRERFEIYCSVCHGLDGAGNGMIIQRGFPRPPSLHEKRLREAPIGHFYDVITTGYGVMYSYASRIEPEDRWAIAAYIRALQFSQNATLQDADDPGRKQLEATKP